MLNCDVRHVCVRLKLAETSNLIQDNNHSHFLKCRLLDMLPSESMLDERLWYPKTMPRNVQVLIQLSIFNVSPTHVSVG